MKITKRNHLGLNMTPMRWEQLKDAFRQTVPESHKGDKDHLLAKDYIILKHIAAEGNKNYLFTGTALEIAERIKIKLDKFDYTMLQDVQRECATLLIDQRTFFRYWTDATDMFIIRVQTHGEGMMEYLTFDSWRIGTREGILSITDQDPKVVTQFLQLMIFLEFSDVELDFLDPGRSNKKSRAEGKVMNASEDPVTVVDSKWNTIVIRSEGFAVSGHFRLQRVGKGLKEIKLVYIEEYLKEGYKRGVGR